MKHILLVVEREETGVALRPLLAAHGYAVDSARYCSRALERGCQALPDLVLAELMTPATDGQALRQRWKMGANRRAIPFAVLAAADGDCVDGPCADRSVPEALVLDAAETQGFMSRIEELLAPAGSASPSVVDATDRPGPDERERMRELEARVLRLEQENRELAGREKVLRDAGERLRLAVQASNVGLWDWDMRTNRADFSPEWKHQLGLGEHEIENDFSEWERRVHSDDVPALRERLERYLSGADARYEVEFQLRHKNGSFRWMYSRAEVFRDEDGTPIRMMGCHVDITDRKRAEEQVREWTDRHDAAIRCSGHVIYDWQVGADECTFSGNLDQMFGYTPAELTPTLAEWLTIVHPDDVPAFRAELERSLTSRSFFRLEYRVRHRYGWYVLVQDSGYLVEDPAGNVQRIVGLLADITERKRAEEELRTWRDRYDAAIRSSGQIVYDWDAIHDCASYGGSVEQTLGRSTADIDGKVERWSSFVHPDDAPAFMAEVERCVAGKTPFDLEYRVQHRDGRWLVVQDTGYPVYNAAGQLERIVGLVADITERKRAEEARVRFESHVRQVQKMEALGTLAGGIAHDFNNILGAIIGNAELASGDVSPDHPVQSSLREINKASARARDLVKQILTFSRGTRRSGEWFSCARSPRIRLSCCA